MPTSTTINATGGTISNTVINGWTVRTHTFTSSGSFVVTGAGASDVIEYIVVGGGGGGTYNNYVGSGGGGAEVKYANSTVTNSTYTITVGAGGTAKSTASYGGGGAGGSSNIAGAATLGALGGPGSGMNGNPDATGTYTYGTGAAYAGAGAGGANQAGQGSNGGNGKLITTGIFSTNTTYYGGGGSGGLASASGLTSLSGGLGGGAGATLSGGQPATPNSGGGGAGGSANQGTPASDGAAGVVRISYYVAPALGVYANVSTVNSGNSVAFTLYSATSTGNIPYTISGVTSAQINNASLTGNFVLSGGSGTVTVTTSSGLSSIYTMTMTSDGSTANVTVSPNVSITTAIIGTSYAGNSTYLANPIAGQMNINESMLTVAQYDKGGSTVSAFAIPGQMNINQSNVNASDMMLGTKPLLPVFANMQANTVVPFTTITNKIAGNLDMGIVKVFGDNPNRELWM